MSGMLPGVGVGLRRRSLPSRQDDHPAGRREYFRDRCTEPPAAATKASTMDEAALMARWRLEQKLGSLYSNPRVVKDSREQSKAGSRMLLGRRWSLGFDRLRKSDRKVCAVCLDDLRGGERQVMDLSCSHKYHSECLLPWIADHPHCPCCRKPI